MALAGHVSRAMMERYSHIRMEAKRKAMGNQGQTGRFLIFLWHGRRI